MSTTTRTRTEIACESCETVYVVDAAGSDSGAALDRCTDCGETAFRALDTDGGARSYSTP